MNTATGLSLLAAAGSALYGCSTNWLREDWLREERPVNIRSQPPSRLPAPRIPLRADPAPEDGGLFTRRTPTFTRRGTSPSANLKVPPLNGMPEPDRPANARPHRRSRRESEARWSAVDPERPTAIQLGAPPEAAGATSDVAVEFRLDPLAVPRGDGRLPGGREYVAVAVRVRCLAGVGILVNPEQFSLEVEGVACPRALSAAVGRPLRTTALPQGGEVEGQLVFEAPAHTTAGVLRYVPARPTDRVRYQATLLTSPAR